jgi:hypothetical protein
MGRKPGSSNKPKPWQTGHDLKLAETFADMYADPYTFVKFGFPWGEAGTILENEEIDVWQEKFLKDLGEAVWRTAGDANSVIRMATATGHGPGKTAMVAWIILWHMSTRVGISDVITANTATQLSTKTWRELNKWHKLFVAKHWFTWTATKFYRNDDNTQAANAIPWSEKNPEAFAGTHEGEVLVVFDEASAVADVIHETIEGALTTGKCIYLLFGNPTRNDGKFRECFRKYRHRWNTRQLDAREAKRTNKEEMQRWIDDYGEDSDFVRVKVKGQFPRASMVQFIPGDRVDAAMKRELRPEEYRYAPVVIGVDVARFGDDQSVIAVRQGLKLVSLEAYRELTTMRLASLVAAKVHEVDADAVFVDGIGIGAGVVDRLRQLGHDVVDVVGGEAPMDRKYFNKRAEMWGLMKEWLKNADIVPDQGLFDDLTGPEYGFSDKAERIQLEKKEDMKARGVPSPDKADAVALTFAEQVIARRSRGFGYGEDDYDIDEFTTIEEEPKTGRCETTGY